MDVARSLKHRNDFSLETGVNHWLTHVKSALEHTAAQPRIFVFYEDFIANWQLELNRLSQFLGRTKLSGQPDIQAEVQGFIESDLQHYRTSFLDAVDDPDLTFPAKPLYAVLRIYVGNNHRRTRQDGGGDQKMQRALNSFSNYCVLTQSDLNKV